MKVAIIDDEINQDIITDVSIKKTFLKIEGNAESLGFSHSTKIVSILKAVASEFEVLNIVIMEKDAHGTIEGIADALKICLEEEVDIVSMSLGTTKLSEYYYLKDYIKKLNQKGVLIVSALNNNSHMTIPACMNTVLGVRYDHLGLLPKNSIRYSKNDFLNIEFVVNYNFKQIDEDIYPSNSFAVPIVVGKIINCIKKQDYFKADKIFDFCDFYSVDYEDLIKERIEEMPICCVKLENYEDLELVSNILDCLHKVWGYETGGMLIGGISKDYRLLSYKKEYDFYNKITSRYLWSILDIDILFLVSIKNNRGNYKLFQVENKISIVIEFGKIFISAVRNFCVDENYIIDKHNMQIIEICQLLINLISRI